MAGGLAGLRLYVLAGVAQRVLRIRIQDFLNLLDLGIGGFRLDYGLAGQHVNTQYRVDFVYGVGGELIGAYGLLHARTAGSAAVDKY